MTESDKDDLTEFKVHFRGIAMYVANSKPGFLTEVVFPAADQAPPDGEDDGIVMLPPDKYHKEARRGRKMKHADGSDATEHFAGALIIQPDGSSENKPLRGCNVERADSSGMGSRMDADFTKNVPSLDKIILDPPKRLKLLHNTKDATRVATRFLIDGGKDDRATAVEPAGGKWLFDCPNGHTSTPRDYRLEVLWTIQAKGPLTFVVTDMKGKNPWTITLDRGENGEPNGEVYFYNFDVENPTLADLTTVHDAQVGEVDHDFKWLYKLMEKENVTWHSWLAKTCFPAPVLVGAPLVSVSTCFEAVWTGPSSDN